MKKKFIFVITILLYLSSGLASAKTSLVYDTVQGVSLLLDMYAPKKVKRSSPALMFIHGGCFSHGSKDGIPGDVKKMTQDGFVVFSVQYRLSGVAKYPAAVDDVREAIRFIRKNAKRLRVDPTKIMVHGESAGGYLAAILGIREIPDREGNIDEFSAPVAFVSDWFGRTDFTATQTTGGDCAESFLGYKRTHETMESFRKASVTHVVSKKSARFIMIHGTQDQQVYPYHSTHLANKLERKKLPYELYFVDGKGHGFPRQTPWALTRKAMLETLGKETVPVKNKPLIFNYTVTEEFPLSGAFELSLQMKGGEKVGVWLNGTTKDFHPVTRTLRGRVGIIDPEATPKLKLSIEDERESRSLLLKML
jgi:acetyl esterase/lipase